MNKIISLIGLDQIGKQSQSILLHETLRPSTIFSFPDYRHWSGQYIKASLHGEPFSLNRGDSYSAHTEPERDPYIMQMVQQINRRAAQPEINKALETGHVIMDRYDWDAMAYGTAEGCPIDWTYNLLDERMIRRSDLTIALVGHPFRRDWEVEDNNEKDHDFQEEVRARHEALCILHPEELVLLDVDLLFQEDFGPPKPLESLERVHRKIVEIVNNRLKLGVRPLCTKLVAETLERDYRLPVQEPLPELVGV